jgi:hypothetical protein
LLWFLERRTRTRDGDRGTGIWEGREAGEGEGRESEIRRAVGFKSCGMRRMRSWEKSEKQ